MFLIEDIIGQWNFNYWPEKKQKCILNIRKDGYAHTSNGTWYQWKIQNDEIIIIYNEFNVFYIGKPKRNTLEGTAFSEYSGNKWLWYAEKIIQPIISPITKQELLQGWWTLNNDEIEVTNDKITFYNNNTFKSENYSIGLWELTTNELILKSAHGFLKYSARCENGIICGTCKNQIGISWQFNLIHTYIPNHHKIDTLTDYSIEIKEDADLIKNILFENGIQYFYHFTAENNIKSIKKYNGLYSWKYLVDHGIYIPDAGGDELSRVLDTKAGIENYVRLSFCSDHPMRYRKKQTNPKLLKIDIVVALWKDTLFSDINAASPKHKHGATLKDLMRVNFTAIKRTYVKKDDPDFHTHQAEIMVKSHIPQKYILNINEF